MFSVARSAALCAVLTLTLAAARPASADTLTLMWDPSPETAAVGYVVYVGTQSHSYANAYDVGNRTSFTWDGAASGQQYYFAVAAYTPGPTIGSLSPEISRYPNLAPSLTNPGPQSGTAGVSAILQLLGSDADGGTLTYGASGLPTGLQVTSGGVVSGIPSVAGSFLVTATVTDGSLSAAETFAWTIAAPPAPTPSPEPAPTPTPTPTPTPDPTVEPDPPPPTSDTRDTTPPSIRITMPTSAKAFAADQGFVTVGGTANDNRGVTGVEWATDRGNKGTATGTDAWLAGVPLHRGQNTITIRARDAVGNTSTTAIVIKWAGKAK